MINPAYTLAGHFSHAIKEIYSSIALQRRLVSHIHMLVSIWIAQHLFSDMNEYKMLFFLYVLLSVQLAFFYIEKRFWKDLSFIILSIFLFFGVFLIKHQRHYNRDFVKVNYQNHDKAKKRNGHHQDYSIVPAGI